ncbi:MAG TPA: indole-3-glycerol phosphate synthase TrpC [Selenomonadales bacterium]|nr:indole-3-glycerol phosphate synthase TrpC [Selenomonadales bacterium]
MLKRIVESKRQEVARAKQEQPLARLKQERVSGSFRLSKAISEADWALIAECKLASPSKGRLGGGHSVSRLAGIYGQNGATAVSVLTDRHFDGSIDDLPAVRAATGLPILRKDFIVDSYQIYEARAFGADAVLLIAAILTDSELQEFLAEAEQIGLDCLVEVHSESELQRVLATPARLIGINNRDLATFSTAVKVSLELLPHCGSGRLVISESGIRGRADALRLKAAGARGILVGEHLVTAGDIAAKTRELALLKHLEQEEGICR